MDADQIAQELQDLNDVSVRQQANLDEVIRTQAEIIDRRLPASVADVKHLLVGLQELLAGLAGTVHKLAVETHSLSDRLDLAERSIDGVEPRRLERL